MAPTIRKRVAKDGTVAYHIVISEPQGADGRRRQRRETFRTKRDAEHFLAVVDFQMRTGTYAPRPKRQAGPKPAPSPAVLPPGWLPPNGDGARPDPAHPAYPFPHDARPVNRLRVRLETDEQLARTVPHLVDALAPAWAEAIGAVRPDPRGGGGVEEFVRRVLAARVGDRVRDAGPTDVLASARRAFVMGKVYDGLVARLPPSPEIEAAGRRLLPPLEPVALRFDPEAGEFRLTFAAAGQNERHLYDDLVDDLQEHLGWSEARDRGGNEDRTRNPLKAEQAMTAAKLAKWFKLKQAATADFLGFEGTDKAKRERIRRTVIDGTKLLDDDPNYGPGWENAPPPSLAAVIERPKAKN